MSEEFAQPRRPGKAELLAWLGQRLRTWGWDAVVAYDSEVLNRVLQEEYAARLGSGTYLAPITASVVLQQDRAWTQLHDYQLDAPRLSFESTTLEHSLATLTLHAVSGRHMQVERHGVGPKHVTRIHHVHPLQRTRVTARIALTMAPGKVDEAGNMQISLCQGLDFEVEASDVDAHRRLIGSHFKVLFNALPVDKKVFVLCSVGTGGSESLINPKQFALRAHCAPGANLRGAANQGDGEVMMFIAMKGNPTSQIPNHLDMFLVPEGSACTVLLSNHLLTRGFVERGQSTWTQTAPAIEYLDPGQGSAGPIRKVTITGPAWVDHPDLFSAGAPGTTPLHWTKVTSDLAAPAAAATFAMTKIGETLEIHWTAKVAHRLSQLYVGSQLRICNHSFIARRVLGVRLLGNGDLGLEKVQEEDIEALWIEIHTRDGRISPDQIRAVMQGHVAECLRDTLDHFTKPASSMPVHKLLIFPHDEAALHSDTVHFPHDVAVFCNLPLPDARFRVEPKEAMVGAGGTLQFSTSPAARSVEWTAQRPGGATAGCGHLSAAGHYVAPSGEEFEESFFQVRITARALDGRQSSALLWVMAQDVVINPVVSVADPHQPTRLHISALDDAPVDVTLDTRNGAELRSIPAAAPGSDLAYWYQPGAVTGALGVDTVTATNLRSGTAVHAHVLVNTMGASATVTLEPLGRGEYRLTLCTADGACAGTVWTLLAGEGHLDPERAVYTPGDRRTDGYAVISGSTADGADCRASGWIILPVPLPEGIGATGTPPATIASAA
jgi:hypothetical protein